MHALVRTNETALEIPSDHDDAPNTGNSLLAAGGIVAALGASTCCILPLVLFTLGVSGAWIGNLTALATYQPFFVAAAVGFIALGFLRVYRRQPVACAEGYCARPASFRVAKIGLFTAAFLVCVALAFPYIARFLLET
jgi:mercuric ion transport protein